MVRDALYAVGEELKKETIMNDNLHTEYGNAGYRFPRTTGEAFGPGETIFVATEEDEELDEFGNFSFYFGLVVYTMATLVIVYILMDM